MTLSLLEDMYLRTETGGEKKPIIGLPWLTLTAIVHTIVSDSFLLCLSIMFFCLWLHHNGHITKVPARVKKRMHGARKVPHIAWLWSDIERTLHTSIIHQFGGLRHPLIAWTLSHKYRAAHRPNYAYANKLVGKKLPPKYNLDKVLHCLGCRHLVNGKK